MTALTFVLIGASFGFWLETSGLASPRKLNAQFTLRDWTVFKVMFVAIVVAAVGIYTLSALGILDPNVLKIHTSFYWAMAVGGALLGLGLALGGYCPGTSVAGLFSGRVDALLFILGLVLGTLVFAAGFGWIEALYQAAASPPRYTLANLTGLPAGLVVLGLVVLAAAGYYLGSVFEKRGAGVIRAEDLHKDG